jgi:AcrR family transcriptional regulator
VPAPAPRQPRSDALRNRERVLDAATELVPRDGEKVPMAQIAEHAGVGVGTVYDTIRLLLTYASQRLGVEPSRLDLGQLDAPLIGAFLDHLETDRGCGARTRNTRLAAIRTFYAGVEPCSACFMSAPRCSYEPFGEAT